MSWLADRVVEHLADVASWPDASGTKYSVVELLGRGGMGTVYLARDEELDRLVALKVANSAAEHPEFEARLRTEARVLARLEHPGIVPVHDVGTLADGRPFYVMKYVRGETLMDRVAAAQLHERLHVFERICETVAFAHARGFVHRDLKPENVMLGSFGEVWIMDWGVAKVLGEASAGGSGHRRANGDGGHTASGTVMGTPGFMPPEQAAGETHQVDARCDVYALGAILYVMLTGQRPPPEWPTDPMQLIRQASAAPKRLQAVCATALATEPGRRYADAGALAEEIARFRAGQAVLAYPERTTAKLARLVVSYRTPILLLLAYLLMRLIVAVTTA